jgi:hypothetical protein
MVVDLQELFDAVSWPREVFMRRSLALSLLTLSLLVLLVGPASAEIFRVTLNNGQIFETAYQPQEASWDPGMVLVLDDVGNWIGISKADVQQVATVNETGAYGVMISKNTFEIGISANDAEAQADATMAANGAPGQGQAGTGADAARLQLLQMEVQQQQAEMQRRQAEQNYSVKQFVEPGQLQGIPSRFVGQPSSPAQTQNH